MKKYFFFLSILLIIYFLTAAFNNADWDLWARLAVGKIFFTTGAVLKHDIFAYTPTKPMWIDHEWLSGVVFYWLAEKFGDTGLSLLKFFLLFSVFLAIFRLNQLKFPEQNHYRIIYYGFFLYALMFGFANTIRAQCFTYVFFALWMYLLEKLRSGENKIIWIFPATMLLWANLHGGFFAGLGLVLLYGIGEALNKRRFAKYFVIFAISTLVTLINPYGFKYWPYMISAILVPRPFITEWQPLNLFEPFNTAFGFKIFAIFAIISLFYVFIKKFKDINWAEILLLAVTFWLSLQHIRHNMFFMIATAGYMTGYLYEMFNNIIVVIPNLFRNLSIRGLWLKFTNGKTLKPLGYSHVTAFQESKAPLAASAHNPQVQGDNPKINVMIGNIKDLIIYTLIIIMGTLTIWFVPLKVKVNNTRFPTRAVKFIEQNHLSGNLLVLFNWGSYALWKLYPQCLIAVDGRYDGVYTESFINEVARFHYLGKGLSWMDLINKYHTDIILINTEYDVYKNLLMLNDWKIVYKDGISAIFVPGALKKTNWKIPDEKYNTDNDKFKSPINLKRILN